jgi:CubicO group peptidase (beta-lactamase class C family)
MLYSTGSSHLLSAVLTRAAGRSTLALARDWLGGPLDITIPPWPRDPQGIYFGGNDMLLSPRGLLRFGEMYRQGGVFAGRRVLPEAWVEASWTPQVHSPFTGHSYGYGWFTSEARGYAVRYAWGYGGQMLYVVPDLALAVVMTSDTDAPSGRTGYARELHALLAEVIIPAVAA